MSQQKEISDKTAERIDEEVKNIVDKNYKNAQTILTAQLDKLHLMADALMKYETIDAKQIDEIMAGKDPTPPEDWDELKAKEKSTQSPRGKRSGDTAKES